MLFKASQEFGNTANLLTLLQKLLTIPNDEILGGGMWDLILKRYINKEVFWSSFTESFLFVGLLNSVDKVTMLNTSKGIESATVSVNYDELKKLILQKETLSDASSAIRAQEGTIKRQRTRIEELEKSLSDMKAKEASFSPFEIQKKVEQAIKEEQLKQRSITDSIEDEVKQIYLLVDVPK